MVAYSFKQRFVMPIRFGLNQMGERDPKTGEPLTCELVVEPGSTVAVPFDPFKHLAPEARPKRQTIRAVGKRRHARPSETLQLYTAMRTKQCKLIGKARCVSVDSIAIHVGKHEIRSIVAHDVIVENDLDGFARCDGFDDAEDMHKFWKEEHGVGSFVGLLIKWEPLT